MEQFGISKLDLKRRNSMQILKQLPQHGPTSRIDLSSSLELTRAAVTIITNEMIEQGVLYEKGEAGIAGQKATRGRKKILIDINKNFRFAFGIAIDGLKIHIGLSNISGEVLEKRQLEIHPNDINEVTLHHIFVNMKEMMAYNCLEENQILGIGVCLNNRSMRIMKVTGGSGAPNYSELKQEFEKNFQIPVTFDSMISGIARAEVDFMCSTVSSSNLIVIRFSDNIDATIMVRNEIYRGYHNQAMNIAHMIVKPDGERCSCGHKGCALNEFSDDAVYVRIVNAFSKENTPLLYDYVEGNVNSLRVAGIFDYICLNDPGVMEIFKDCVKSFAIFINNIASLADPEKIVFFGTQFEREQFMQLLKEISAEYLGEEILRRVTSCRLKQNEIFLSGCALAVRQFFIQKGGF